MLSDELRRLIQDEFDNKWNAGIEVVFVGVAGIHPPVDVAASFEQVLEARETHEAVIETARGNAIKRLSTTAGTEARARSIALRIAALRESNASEAERMVETLAIEADLMAAGGSAAAKILSAKADRWQTHMTQSAYATRQRSRMGPYLAAPEYYRYREYLSMLVRSLQGRQIVIVPDGVEVRSTIDLQSDPTLLNPTNIGAAMSESSIGGE
jgi:regulator of protease activity HflC (stomatin/prohibitin superfamily)